MEKAGEVGVSGRKVGWATGAGSAARGGSGPVPLPVPSCGVSSCIACTRARRRTGGGAVTIKGVLPDPVLSPPLRVCERKVMPYVHLGRLPCSLRRNENCSNWYTGLSFWFLDFLTVSI